MANPVRVSPAEPVLHAKDGTYLRLVAHYPNLVCRREISRRPAVPTHRRAPELEIGSK
jgi:hypothetical protein